MRGEIWWIDFGEPLGSEPGYRRPALIVSSDRFNRSKIATVIVSAITSNMRLTAAPGNVELHEDEVGLPQASVVNVSQTMVIDRFRLIERVGKISPHSRKKVDDGLRLVLGL